MERRHYVYALFRPNGHPFYIGMGCGDRIDHHLHRRSKGRSHRESLIRSIVSQVGDLPRAKIAEGLTVAQAGAMERALIAALGRYPNGPLLNQTDGADGLMNLTPEALAARGAKISATKRARADLRGRKPPKEKVDPEVTRERRRAAALAVRADPEKTERIIRAIREAYQRPEVLARNAAGASAYWERQGAEERAVHGKKMVKVLAAPEVRAKMSASSQKRWADPKERERYREIGRHAAAKRWGDRRALQTIVGDG